MLVNFAGRHLTSELGMGCAARLFYDPIQVYCKSKYKGGSGEGISGGRHIRSLNADVIPFMYHTHPSFPERSTRFALYLSSLGTSSSQNLDC